MSGLGGALLGTGLGAGDAERADEAVVGGVDDDATAGGEGAASVSCIVAETVADHRLGVTDDRIDADRRAGGRFVGHDDRTGDGDGIGCVGGSDEHRASGSVGVVERPAADDDRRPVADLGEGRVDDHRGRDRPLGAGGARCRPGSDEGHGEVEGAGVDDEAVGAERDAIVDPGLGVVAVPEESEAATGGRGIGGGVGVHAVAAHRPHVGLAAADRIGRLEVARQVDRLVDALGGHAHRLVTGAEVRGIQDAIGILVDLRPRLDRGRGRMGEHEDGHGPGERLLLAVASGLCPGVEEVVVETAVVVDVAREVREEGVLLPRAGAAEIRPAILVGEILRGEIETDVREPDILVPTADIAVTGVPACDFDGVAVGDCRRARGGGVIGGLVLERLDEIHAPQ